MSLGNLIDAILSPLLHVIKVIYLTAAVDNANKSADVEKQKAQDARAAEMYFQKRSLDLRMELLALKNSRTDTKSKFKAWFESYFDSHQELEALNKKGASADDIAA